MKNCIKIKNVKNFILINYFNQTYHSSRLLPDISLNKFAIDNDIDPATLSRVENEKQGVSICLLSKIAKGFGTVGSNLLCEYEKLYKN